LSKSIYRNLFWLHALVVALIFCVGLFKVVQWITRLMWPSIKRAFPPYAQNKNFYLKGTSWLLAYLLFTLVFGLFESKLRRHLKPGQAFAIFSPVDTLINQQQILCDETGMNYQSPL